MQVLLGCRHLVLDVGRFPPLAPALAHGARLSDLLGESGHAAAAVAKGALATRNRALPKKEKGITCLLLRYQMSMDRLESPLARAELLLLSTTDNATATSRFCPVATHPAKMKLPHLDQLIPLERGEAGLLSAALAVLVADAIERPPMAPSDALLLTPLGALGRRLVARRNQELQRPPRPGKKSVARPLRVHYDELAAVHQVRYALYYTGLAETEKLQLQRVLGEFQRHSLGLECYIRFRF
jgi:hypothetical protein